MLDAGAALTQDSSVEWVQVGPRSPKGARLWLGGLLALLVLGSGCTGPGLEPPGGGQSRGVDEMTQGGAGGVSGQAGVGGAGGASAGTGGTGGAGGIGGAGGLPLDGSGVGDAAVDFDEDAGTEDEQ